MSASNTAGPLDDSALAAIRRALDGLAFGEVLLVVNDGVIVEVSRTDKIRLPRGAKP